jgi:hypothetical protein
MFVTKRQINEIKHNYKPNIQCDMTLYTEAI